MTFREDDCVTRREKLFNSTVLTVFEREEIAGLKKTYYYS